MTLGEYQRLAMRTKSKDAERGMKAQLNAVLGLSGEIGEVVELYKKHLFHGHTLETEKVIKEAGDIQWYLALLADGLGISLDEIAAKNIEKLNARYPQGFDTLRSIHKEKFER